MKTLRFVLVALLVFGGCSPSGKETPSTPPEKDFPTMFFEGVEGTQRWSLAKFYTVLAYDKYPGDEGCSDEVGHFRDLYEIQLYGQHLPEAMVRRMPNFDEVFDEHAVALGKLVFSYRARSVDGDLYWHGHLFHLRVDALERIHYRDISLDSIGVSEWEAREMILVSGNEHIKSIIAGNYDGEESEYDVAREMLGLGFSPGQISALPIVAVDSVSKGLR